VRLRYAVAEWLPKFHQIRELGQRQSIGFTSRSLLVSGLSEGSLVLQHRGSFAVSSLRGGYPECHAIRARVATFASTHAPT
jgi:hypothetical protein